MQCLSAYLHLHTRARERERVPERYCISKNICDDAKKLKTDHNLPLIVDFCERSFRNLKLKFNFLLHFGREAEDA